VIDISTYLESILSWRPLCERRSFAGSIGNITCWEKRSQSPNISMQNWWVTEPMGRLKFRGAYGQCLHREMVLNFPETFWRCEKFEISEVPNILILNLTDHFQELAIDYIFAKYQDSVGHQFRISSRRQRALLLPLQELGNGWDVKEKSL